VDASKQLNMTSHPAAIRAHNMLRMSQSQQCAIMIIDAVHDHNSTEAAMVSNCGLF
jgi:hypothetical protein